MKTLLYSPLEPREQALFDHNTGLAEQILNLEDSVYKNFQKESLAAYIGNMLKLPGEKGKRPITLDFIREVSRLIKAKEGVTLELYQQIRLKIFQALEKSGEGLLVPEGSFATSAFELYCAFSQSQHLLLIDWPIYPVKNNFSLELMLEAIAIRLANAHQTKRKTDFLFESLPQIRWKNLYELLVGTGKDNAAQYLRDIQNQALLRFFTRSGGPPSLPMAVVEPEAEIGGFSLFKDGENTACYSLPNGYLQRWLESQYTRLMTRDELFREHRFDDQMIVLDPQR